MNAQRFRKQLHRHADRGVDWTHKRRVTYSVLIQLASIRSEHDRALVSRINSYTDAGKCPITAFDATNQWLVLGSGVTYQSKADTLEIASYAKICYRLLRKSGLDFRIRPTAPAHFLPNESEEESLQRKNFDWDKWDQGDPTYHAHVQEISEHEAQTTRDFLIRLKEYGCLTDEGMIY